MATLKIIRSNEHTNRMRDIKLFLNEKEIGDIANSSTKLFPIELGDYTLQAKIDWCSSNKIPFKVSSNEILEFDLMSFAKGKYPNALSALYHLYFKPSSYLILKKSTA